MVPDLKTLQTELDDARQEARNLTVTGLNPKFAAEAVLIRELERSARAEVKLRVMALEHAKSQQQS